MEQIHTTLKLVIVRRRERDEKAELYLRAFLFIKKTEANKLKSAC